MFKAVAARMQEVKDGRSQCEELTVSLRGLFEKFLDAPLVSDESSDRYRKDRSGPPEGTGVREFKIYGWNPDDTKNPVIDTFAIDLNDCGPMVLEGQIKIKSEIDTTLTFRRSVAKACAVRVQ